MQWLSLRGRYWNSLRLRIQLWHALVLAVLIISFGSVLYFMQRWTRFREIDNELAAAIEVLNGQLKFVDPSMPTEQGKITVLSVPDTFAPRRVKDAYELPYYILWGPTGEVLHDSRVERSSLISQPGTYAAIRGVRFRNRGEFREAFANGSKGGTVLVGRFIGPDLRDLSELLLVLLVTGITMFIVGLAGGWFISAKSIKPIETIGRVAREISESDLRQRIDTGQMTTELSELSQTLNDTFARLEAAFLRQKQFTADASHDCELRYR